MSGWVRVSKSIAVVACGLLAAGCSMHVSTWGMSKSSSSQSRPSYVAAPKTSKPVSTTRKTTTPAAPPRQRYDYVEQRPLAPIAPRAERTREYSNWDTRRNDDYWRRDNPTYAAPKRPEPRPRYESRDQDRSVLVRQGETLYSIAQYFQTSVNELIDYNNLRSSELEVGQRIYIPPRRTAGSW